MNKEELHKAAEEFYPEWCKKNTRGTTLIKHEEAIKCLTDFHLHQTKKMLEGWTDDRIKSLIDVGGKMNFEFANGERWEAPADYTSEIRGAKQFRDELLKQLENEKTT